MGLPSGFYRTVVASDPDVYCVTSRRRPYAAGEVPYLHFPWILAMVPGAGLVRHEAGGELAGAGQVFSPLRHSHPDYWCVGSGLVRMVTLAESNQGSPIRNLSAGDDS